MSAFQARALEFSVLVELFADMESVSGNGRSNSTGPCSSVPQAKKKHSKETKRTKQWFLKRAKFGYSELLKELRNNERDHYKNFLIMDGLSFDELLKLVGPHNIKQDAVMRKVMPPADRLSLTLRFRRLGIHSKTSNSY
ncbi:hypothetical protein ElyMa_000766600 [Elysia marginata]|uniref:SAM domain-containing protein n=1 Tax=Elysia marginata TaxID=1093978 RepID=A0AAV4GU57_9GAST|nr:hypothetical protein ElyMa_000766600 [Elysia marginata]